jgi:cytochrome d ubiquinol oxidase subunit I
MPRSRWFYRCAAVAGVASVLAVEPGWITAEVGRQPWIVYEYMRVSEAVTDISAGPIWLSFAIVVFVYALVALGFIALLLRMKLRWRQQDAALASAKTTGPDISAQPGSRSPEKVGE